MFDEFSGVRPDAKKYMILLYDGLSTDRNTAFIAAKLLHRSTTLTAVGMGSSVGYSELVNIASDADHAFIYLHWEDVYNRLLKDIVDKECTGRGISIKTVIFQKFEKVACYIYTKKEDVIQLPMG